MFVYAVILGILVVVSYLIFQPLLRPKGAGDLPNQERDMRARELVKEKENVYAAIKEMEFDFGMGKISEEDYQELRSEYKAKALEIFKELDTVGAHDDVNGAIEREVKRLRGKKMGKKRRDKRKESGWKINFCPECGRKVVQGHKFCQGCGLGLTFPGERG